MKHTYKKRFVILLMSGLILSQSIGATNITYAETKYVSRGVPRDAKDAGSFKTYMDFRTITDKSSEQYEFQKKCKTDNNGLRRYNEDDLSYYVVAMGSFYSEEIGTKFKITLDNNGTKNVIYVILGDCKKDEHTDDSNRFIEKNGNIIEFIVSQRDLPSLARKMGDVSYADDELRGEIVKIEEIKF